MRTLLITLLIWPLALVMVLLDRLGRLADLLLTLRHKQPTAPEPEAAPEPAPAVDYASLLEALTVRDLRKTCVTLGLPRSCYRSARKADLVALLADLSVNPLL
jgi:hypothetical protein